MSDLLRELASLDAQERMRRSAERLERLQKEALSTLGTFQVWTKRVAGEDLQWLLNERERLDALLRDAEERAETLNGYIDDLLFSSEEDYRHGDAARCLVDPRKETTCEAAKKPGDYLIVITMRGGERLELKVSTGDLNGLLRAVKNGEPWVALWKADTLVRPARVDTIRWALLPPEGTS